MATFIRHVRLSRVRNLLHNTTEGCFVGLVYSSRQLHTKTIKRLLSRTNQSERCSIMHCQPHHQIYLCGAYSLRSNSTSTTAQAITESLPTDFIPAPPPIPDVSEILQPLNALGEPTLTSLGLGGWMPAGMVQTGLDWLHVSADLPWWGAIMIGTLILRVVMFPIVIKAQRNVAHMNNHMPTIVRLQERMSEARGSGNPMEAARAGHELMDYMKRNNVNVLKSMLVPLAQLPVFLSVFVGIRQMANLPVESMKSGGMLWFTDLSIPDPIYGLPLMAMTTLLATFELGADGVKTGTQTHVMKWVMRGMPVFMFPFISNFPAAMLCYWTISNFISLLQAGTLKIPAVRDFFKIERLVKHEKSMVKKKGFVEGFRDSMQNSKLAGEMEDRERRNALTFKKAGEGPVPKTYAYDPTKVRSIKAYDPTKVRSIKEISAKPKS